MTTGRGPEAAPGTGSPHPSRPWYRRLPVLFSIALDVFVAVAALAALANGAPWFVIVVAVIVGFAPWAAIIDEQERPRRR